MKARELTGITLSVSALHALKLWGTTAQVGKSEVERFWLIDQKGERCLLKNAVSLFDMKTGSDIIPHLDQEFAGLICDKFFVDTIYSHQDGIWMAGVTNISNTGEIDCHGTNRIEAILRVICLKFLGENVYPYQILKGIGKRKA
jgi:hypothetical protein